MGLGWFDVSLSCFANPVMASLNYQLHFVSANPLYEKHNKETYH